MASDLDVTTAAWGSQNLLLASGDDISGATGYGWGTQVAQNTGWLYYQPRPMHAETSPTIAPGDAATYDLGYVYLTAGTYSFYGYAVADKADTPASTLTFDGTTLVTFSGTVAATGSLCGWTLATAGWKRLQVIGSADAAKVSIVTASAYRFGSYAP
jgi:hypothetical protein